MIFPNPCPSKPNSPPLVEYRWPRLRCRCLRTENSSPALPPFLISQLNSSWHFFSVQKHRQLISFLLQCISLISRRYDKPLMADPRYPSIFRIYRFCN